jgi:mannose-6-phosphate isomerase-like protein (cupin superfamily)
MASPGDVLTHPGTGEVVRFVRTGAQTGGALLELDVEIAPFGWGGGGLPHKHVMREVFIIREGSLRCFDITGVHDVRAGASIEVPAGRTHVPWNPHPQAVRATVLVEPAGEMEHFLETTFALANGPRRYAIRCRPTVLQTALLAERDGVFGPFLPIPVQRVLLAPLAALARRRGVLDAVEPPVPREAPV